MKLIEYVTQFQNISQQMENKSIVFSKDWKESTFQDFLCFVSLYKEDSVDTVEYHRNLVSIFKFLFRCSLEYQNLWRCLGSFSQASQKSITSVGNIIGDVPHLVTLSRQFLTMMFPARVISLQSTQVLLGIECGSRRICFIQN